MTVPANDQSGIRADVLFGVTSADVGSAGRRLGSGADAAARLSAALCLAWCNQFKKEEGASCAWTGAAAHRKIDSAKVANAVNLTTIASG